MKSKRTLTILACIAMAALLLLGILAACSAKMEDSLTLESQLRDTAYNDYNDLSSKTVPARDYGNVAYDNAAGLADDSKAPAEGGGGEGGEAAQERFVIMTASITIQTKTYDAFIAALNADLKAMGGYTNSYDEWNYDSDRSVNITARVPSQKFDAFLETLGKNGTVVSQSKDRADVTDEMIETGSKKEALKNEETALLAILEQAKTVEDIIRVQDRLSNVRADLQAYSQKLQSLQNQVSYSTVRLEVHEVNRISVLTQKFGTLASSGFVNSLRNIGTGLRNFAIWFIGAIPYLVLLAVPVTLLVIVFRRVRKNRKAKKAGM